MGLNINSNIPDIAKVKDIKGFKNGKCLGTDFLHPEHLRGLEVKLKTTEVFLSCQLVQKFSHH